LFSFRFKRLRSSCRVY